MEVVREIELDAEAEDVWEALTNESQLEEWFANDVELDPTEGGRGVFRWDNGETREAVVESVDEGERIVLRFDDDGVVDLATEKDDPVTEQPRVDVEGSLRAAVGFDHCRDHRHSSPPRANVQLFGCPIIRNQEVARGSRA